MSSSATESPRRMPLIWIVPLISLLIGGYLVYHELRDRGPRITIRFTDATGLVPGQTKVMYKGLPMGVVREIVLLPEQTGVDLKVDLDRGAETLARTESRFWIVRPKIGLSGIRAPETLFTGPVIAVAPGGGGPKREFVGLEAAPSETLGEETVSYVLRTARRGSLEPGRPVTFRGILVGEVEGVELAPEADSVLVRIAIGKSYAGLVRPGTVFWNATGLDVNFSLFRGATIRTGAVDELLAGGIAFATPDASQAPPPADTEFALQESVKDEWQAWASVLPLDGTITSGDAAASTPSARPSRSGGRK
jgi:paraquat-inducible protein B